MVCASDLVRKRQETTDFVASPAGFERQSFVGLFRALGSLVQPSRIAIGELEDLALRLFRFICLLYGFIYFSVYYIGNNT